MSEIKEKRITRIFFVVLFLSVIIVFGNYLTGQKYFLFADSGSDTYDQYYPYYVNCVMRIQEGSFHVWNWEYGPGTSILNNVSQTMDPFGIIVIIGGVLFGVERVKYFLVLAQLLKVILAAVLCRYFLKIRGFSEQASCISGYLYGFNGYLMLWGQHYMLGTGCIYMILVFICIEKLLQSDTWKHMVFVALAVAASFLYSYYNAYMILLFTAIYFLFRVLAPEAYENMRKRLQIMIKCLISVITGILLSGVILLPVANYITVSSSRLDSNTSIWVRFFNDLFSFRGKEVVFETFSRMLSNNIIYMNEPSVPGWQNYYEMPNIYFTLFIYLIVGQFVVHVWKQRYEKKTFIYNCAMIIMAFLVLRNPGIAMAFNGFAYPVSRYTFVVFPVVAVLVSFIWDEYIQKADISIVGIIGGFVFSTVVLYLSHRLAALDVKKYSKIYFAFIVFATIILLTMKHFKEKRGMKVGCLICLVCLIGVSTTMDAYLTNNHRITFGKEREVQKFEDNKVVNDTTQALNYIHSIDESFYRVDLNYVESTPLGDSLINRYSSATYYNSTINRNLGNYYRKLYSNAGVSDRVNIFTLTTEEDLRAISLLNIKYILSKEPLNNSYFEALGQSGSVYIYRNKETDSVAKWYQKTITKQEYKEMQEGREEVLNTHLIVKEKDQLKEELTPGTCDVGTFRLENDTTLKGSTKSTEKGLLMLAIPDQQGWSIYVDGKKTETFNADYGFLGIELEAGQHEIEARYEIPYLKEGMVISLVGIALLAGMVLYGFVANRRKTSYNN